MTKAISARRSMAALLIAGLLPVSLALSGCGKGPTLPKSEQSEANKRDGGEPVDEKPVRPTTDAPQSAEAPKPAPPLPKPSVEVEAASAAEAQRRAEEAARAANDAAMRERQQSQAESKDRGGSGTYGESAPGGEGRGIGSAQPSPAPAAPPPSASAPPTAAPAPQAPVTAADKAKAYDVVPVFFGTDRAVEADPKRLQYGTDRAHKLQLGRALITVPEAHKVPNIERPWAIEIPYFKVKVYEEKEDPNQHFTVQEISALTKEQMLAYVKERLAKSKNFKDDAFVFVHGFNTSFDASLYRTAQIAYDMKFDGVPFVYSWPSGGKVASYTYDRGSAEQAEPHLTEFLNLVIKESGAKSISLIAHSMGNELLLRVLEQMRSAAPKGVVISQVILAAPDVDRDKFSIIAREITSFAKGVTLYAASNDRALSYSARFWGGVPRAGDVPSSGPLIIPGIDTIDVTSVSTDSLGLNHSGYAENKTLLNDIALLIQTGERPPDKRIPILKRIETKGGPYWRYPPVH